MRPRKADKQQVQLALIACKSKGSHNIYKLTKENKSTINKGYGNSQELNPHCFRDNLDPQFPSVDTPSTEQVTSP